MRSKFQDTPQDKARHQARDKTIYAERLAELRTALSSPDTDPRQRDDLHLQIEDAEAQLSGRALQSA